MVWEGTTMCFAHIFIKGLSPRMTSIKIHSYLFIYLLVVSIAMLFVPKTKYGQVAQ